MKILRVGLVGLGVMGRHHLRVLSSLEQVELVGVYDPYSKDDFRGLNKLLTPSLQSLISLHLDYCVVAAPTALHLEIGTELAQAKVHALIEKPLASDVRQALKIVEMFEQADLIGGVGHIERYNPALQEARRRIALGQLGKIHQISTRRQGPYPARIQDVGVVKDLATHDIDLTSWLVDKSYTRISAQTSHKSGHLHEDFVVAVGTLGEGIISSHIVNWLSPMKERTTLITGEMGAFSIDTLNSDLTFYANGAVDVIREDMATFRGVREGDVIRYAFPKPEPLRTEHEQFRNAVLGTKGSIVSMRQGLENVRVAEAMLESASNRKFVDL